MAVTPSNLLAPTGPVEPELFPGESEGEGSSALLNRLTSYVAQGVAKVSSLTFETTAKEDIAVEAWALYLAFRAAYTLTLARPAREDFKVEVMGATEYQADQRDALKILADDYFGDYQNAIADTGADLAISSGIPSYQSTNLFDW